VDIDKELINKIYSEFYKHYNLDTSVEFQNIYRDRTVNFITENIAGISSNDLSMLDIGCGEGTYFPFFHQQGYSCYGFEPSNKHILASKHNPSAIVSSSYFESTNKNIFNVNFDVILLNWVLEHVIDLDSFFSILKKYCKTGTRIIFQIPDLMYYVDNDLYLFYIHEHIHYFNKYSVECLLNRHGFSVLSYKNSDCPSLIVSAEYIGKEIKGSHIEKSTKNILQFIDKGKILGGKSIEIFNGYDEIIFYGVGTSTYWMGEYYLSSEIKNRVKIIDDNEYYFNKYAPSFNSKIIKLNDVGRLNSAVFFIGTSPVYRDIIIDKILDSIEGCFDICYIENNEYNIIKGKL